MGGAGRWAGGRCCAQSPNRHAGDLKPMAWDFYNAHADEEAFAVLGQDFIETSGVACRR